MVLSSKQTNVEDLTCSLAKMMEAVGLQDQLVRSFLHAQSTTQLCLRENTDVEF